MKNKKFCIITTTINVPLLLEEYANDAIRFGHDLDQIIVVGDNKTPIETQDFCKTLEKKTGIQCRYVSVDEQKQYLHAWTAFNNHLPWNCIQRRNVGLLLAYESNCDIVVTIDDDNFMAQADYLGCHAHLGDVQDLDAVRSQSGWWNICEMLEEENGIPFYHRGHPLSQRWVKDEVYSVSSQVRGRPVVNAGLWLDDPDVDAVARLFYPIQVTGPSEEFQDRIACDIGTWAPFNSQNTALLKEIIPAYLLFPRIGRYDDIWASYVVRHITDHMGDYVTYGSPLVRQKRNPHNFFQDFDDERLGLEYNDIFLGALRSCDLTGKSYRDCYVEIVEQFPNRISKVCDSANVSVDMFEPVITGMHAWRDISIFA